MKVKKTFRLSEESAAVLAQQDNATEYLEGLILGNTAPATPTTSQLTEGRVLYLIQQEIAKIPPMPQFQNTSNSSVPSVTEIPGVTTGAEFTPKPPDPEFGYPCCKGRAPCKHWTWDDTDTLWVNSLTGKTREE